MHMVQSAPKLCVEQCWKAPAGRLWSLQGQCQAGDITQPDGTLVFVA